MRPSWPIRVEPIEIFGRESYLVLIGTPKFLAVSTVNTVTPRDRRANTGSLSIASSADVDFDSVR